MSIPNKFDKMLMINEIKMLRRNTSLNKFIKSLSHNFFFPIFPKNNNVVNLKEIIEPKSPLASFKAGIKIMIGVI